MKKTGEELIQAMELKKGMFGLSNGTFKNIRVISCTDDGDVVIHFPDGDETVSLKAGTDRCLANLDITIVSGLFDIN